MSLLEELKERRDRAEKRAIHHQEKLTASWQDVHECDKAIAALSPSEALLDPQPEAASPEFASEQGAALEEMIATSDAICEELSEAYTAPQIPEGFTPWGGGERPTDATVGAVQVIFEDGSTFKERSTDVVLQDGSWTKLDPYSAYNIIAYRVVEPSAEAERTSDESQAETVNEQTLITDDIPSIPREEIPIGAAVETYTDSGIETVKISGTTYVVDDEPVAEASYAPINSEPASDALMWANGFEADAKAKAEPEQDKRPFWMFAKKEPA